MDTDTLIAMYERNKEFLKSGGITATGGEPMLQLPFLTELFDKAKKKGIHTCLDTSGICFTPDKTDAFEALCQVTDLVMLDIKYISEDKHKALTGHGNDRILAFARFLAEHGIPIWIRHVIVPGWTDSPEEQEALGEFIGTLQTLKALDVLPYHDMGKVKYTELGIPYPLEGVPPLAMEQAEKAKEHIMKGIRRALRKK